MFDCGRFVGMRFDESPLAALTGSFRTPSGDGRMALLQQLTARLLGCGTVRRDRREIADALERRGASRSFEAGAARIAFSAFACADDLPMLADLLAQCLREPRFAPEDVVRERAQLAAELRHAAQDPHVLASATLSRRLFEAGHPHHEPPLEQRIDWLEDLGVDDVRACHEALFGTHELLVVALGGFDPGTCATGFEQNLRAWRPLRASTAQTDAGTIPHRGGTTRIHHPGSTSSSVLIGTRLAFDAADGVTAWFANRILGGSYASRLVASLREGQALTYSVRSELIDPQADLDGVWRVAIALGPDKLERGIAAARAELERFADDDIATDELDRQRRAAIGALLVDAASLQGMGAFLLRNLERGAGAVHVDAFVEALAAVSTRQLQRVAAALQPAGLETVIVGPGLEG
jgi:zinc protease